METLLFLLIIGGGIWFFFIHKSPGQKAEAAVRAAAIVAPAAEPEEEAKWKYRHQHKGTAIAINPAERTIRLRGQFGNQTVEKDYPYADVRSWDFNIISGGMTQTFGNVGVNAAIGVGVANYMQSKRNEAQTGLFIAVRDVDFPEWHVRFAPDRGRELELKRWMEILRQEFETAGI